MARCMTSTCWTRSCRKLEPSMSWIDGCRIQCIQALFQIDTHGLSDIQSARGRNQPVGEVSEDAPVARFVGVRQRRARHLVPESQVIERALQLTYTGLHVAQALPIRRLSE